MNQNIRLFQTADDEAAFRRLWDGSQLGSKNTAEMASLGGTLADRPSWVFIAGYQAAVRHVFPEVPRHGWAAFAASEDQNNPQDNPPLLVEETPSGLVLNGTKSWVAQSRHVDHLIVTARGEHGTPQAFLVDAHASGLTMTHRNTSSFLQSMSQGYARFKDYPVPKSRMPVDRLNLFMRSEARFIMLACAAFLTSHLNGEDQALAGDAKALEDDLHAIANSNHITSITLAGLDDRLQDLTRRFARLDAAQDVPDWQADRSLFALYSKGIQARANKGR